MRVPERQLFTSLVGSALLLTAPGGILASSAPSESRARPASLDAIISAAAVSYVAHRHLEAELVDRGERGWMEVTTRFDRQRGLTHTIEREGGSDRIRRRALSAVLEKEIDACGRDEMRRSALSDENYRHEVVDASWQIVRISLTPRRADARLVLGSAVVDSETGHLLEVQGQLARSPSFWIRDVRIRRTYGHLAGANLPVEFESVAHIRIYGKARLRVRSTYVEVNGRAVPDTDLARGRQ